MIQWWGTDTCFNSPDNTDNECSDHQRAGFDWSDLADGAFSSYGGFDFSGFMSGIGFGGSASGVRSLLFNRVFPTSTNITRADAFRESSLAAALPPW